MSASPKRRNSGRKTDLPGKNQSLPGMSLRHPASRPARNPAGPAKYPDLRQENPVPVWRGQAAAGRSFANRPKAPPALRFRVKPFDPENRRVLQRLLQKAETQAGMRENPVPRRSPAFRSTRTHLPARKPAVARQNPVQDRSERPFQVRPRRRAISRPRRS